MRYAVWMLLVAMLVGCATGRSGYRGESSHDAVPTYTATPSSSLDEMDDSPVPETDKPEQAQAESVEPPDQMDSGLGPEGEKSADSETGSAESQYPLDARATPEIDESKDGLTEKGVSSDADQEVSEGLPPVAERVESNQPAGSARGDNENKGETGLLSGRAGQTAHEPQEPISDQSPQEPEPEEISGSEAPGTTAQEGQVFTDTVDSQELPPAESKGFFSPEETSGQSNMSTNNRSSHRGDMAGSRSSGDRDGISTNSAINVSADVESSRESAEVSTCEVDTISIEKQPEQLPKRYYLRNRAKNEPVED